MAINHFAQFVFDLFILSAIIITAYTVNFYYLAFLSRKRKDISTTIDWGTPSVTIQLPIYNEKYVAKRLVDAVFGTLRKINLYFGDMYILNSCVILLRPRHPC